MSTQDPTISKRSQNLRQRHKAEGDKSCLLWLSPTTQARVARLKQEGETLAQLFDRALEALESVAKPVAERQPEDRQRVEVWVPDGLVDSLRAFLLGGVANSVAQQREEKDRQGEKKTGQDTPSDWPPQDTPLVAQVEELRKQGVSFRDIARRWNAKGIPTPSGRGQWHGATVGRLVNTD
jgi:lambda repressor-like predicted transcriptional regulator